MQEHQYLYVGHSDTASGKSSCCSGKNYCRQFSGEAKKTKKKNKKRKNGKRTSDNGEDTKMMTLRTQMTTKSNMQRKWHTNVLIIWLHDTVTAMWVLATRHVTAVYIYINICVCFHSCRLFRKLKRCVRRTNNSNNKANSWNKSAAWAAESF